MWWLCDHSTEGNADFSIPSQSHSILFEFNFSSEGQQCLNVTIIDDNLLEFDEEFSANITDVSPSGVQIGPFDSTAVVINDDEGMRGQN